MSSVMAGSSNGAIDKTLSQVFKDNPAIRAAEHASVSGSNPNGLLTGALRGGLARGFHERQGILLTVHSSATESGQ